MRAHGGSGIAKTGWPQHRQIEESFHQDQSGEMADRVPGEQAALGTRQETMRESRADTAAIEVDDLVLLAAGKDHAPTESVVTLRVDQTELQQVIETVAFAGEMGAQVSPAHG